MGGDWFGDETDVETLGLPAVGRGALRRAGTREEVLREAGGNDINTDATETVVPTSHYYVDVHNGDESNNDISDQHIKVDPAFRAQIHEGNELNISNFLSLPEIISTK